jgi:hypothetical protein
MLHTHSQRLERWLGAEKVAQLSANSRDFYWPIAVQGVPGAVYAMPGGDFTGRIEAGYECSAYDRAEEAIKRGNRARFRNRFFRQAGMAGFSSLSDLIAEATAGKRREYTFNKVGVTGVVNVANSLWDVGNLPPTGANAAAAPGGTAGTDATTGAIPIDNVSTDTRHFVMAALTASIAANSLLLYDRIFEVLKTMNSTATESVTGVPTRYQSSTPTAADYAGGNFCFVEVGTTALAATAHNWTVCQYRNQAGTDAQSFPSMTGNSGAIARRLDHPVGSWFMPLAGSDVGVMDLAQMQCSAAVATGLIDFVIGHPLAFLPCPVANMVCIIDGINTAFNLVRIFDDACMAFLEMPKPATTATTYGGSITAVHG